MPPTYGDPVIEVSGLTKRYGNTVAVQDLSFRVRRGCVTAFVGPTGRGSRRRCGWCSVSTARIPATLA
jgi:ABC-type branched-subunit amino acid transport system ATPase component